MESTLTRPRVRRHPLLVVALLPAVVLAVLLVVRATAPAREQRWVARCVADGGAVQIRPAPAPNRMLVQSSDPAYVCRTPNGEILRVRR